VKTKSGKSTAGRLLPSAKLPADIERSGTDRLLREAMVDMACDVGCGRLTPTLVCESADLPLVDFERAFSSIDEAVALVFEEQIGQLLERCQAAYDAETAWVDGLRALGIELARWVHVHPSEARFTFVESLSAGDEVALQREASVARLVKLVDRGRELLDAPARLPQGFAVAAVGAVMELLVRRLRKREPISAAELERAIPELMFFVIRPYVTAAQAVSELDRPARL